jgi:hypothetical protein
MTGRAAGGDFRFCHVHGQNLVYESKLPFYKNNEQNAGFVSKKLIN